jgi:short-subunit dehydrogenase
MAIDSIQKEVGCGPITFIPCDLADRKSILKCVDEFKALNTPCDLLISNALSLYMSIIPSLNFDR